MTTYTDTGTVDVEWCVRGVGCHGFSHPAHSVAARWCDAQCSRHGARTWLVSNLHGDVILTVDDTGTRMPGLSFYDPFGQTVDQVTGDIGTTIVDDADPPGVVVAGVVATAGILWDCMDIVWDVGETVLW